MNSLLTPTAFCSVFSTSLSILTLDFLGVVCPSITNCFSQVSLVTVFSEPSTATVMKALAVYLPGLKPLKLLLSEL